MKNKHNRKGRPPLPPERKMRRRPIGMLEADWQKVARLAKREGVSVDEIIRRLVRAIPGAGVVYAEHGG